MKKIQVPFLRKLGNTWHWQPSAAARKLGFKSVACGADEAKAVQKAAELWQAYETKRNRRHAPAYLGTFNHLKDVYYDSDNWSDLSAETKRDYRRYIEKEICARWGNDQVSDMDVEIAKAMHKSMKSKPYAANQCIKVLRTMLVYAVSRPSLFPDINMTAFEKFRLYGKKQDVKARDRRWKNTEIPAFDLAADAELRMARMLYSYTGQRTADVLKMREVDYTIDEDGDRWLDVVQQKTGTKVSIYCHTDLAAALDAHIAMHRRGKTSAPDAPIIQNTLGRAFNRRVFVTRWDDAAVKAGIVTLSGEKGKRRDRSNPRRHDLRRNATTMLAEAGCTDEQISSITGLSISMIRNQIYNVRSRVHSKTAIKKLEQRQAEEADEKADAGEK